MNKKDAINQIDIATDYLEQAIDAIDENDIGSADSYLDEAEKYIKKVKEKLSTSNE